VTSADAQAATQAFASRARPRTRDAALDFAWSTAATIEPWAEGVNFFPRIFADVEASRSSVHILMFGWREGEVGMRMAALLEQKLTGAGTRQAAPTIESCTSSTERPPGRARAFGVISGLGGLGAAAGPLIGGLITTAIS
jgi:hypothetical protein